MASENGRSKTEWRPLGVVNCSFSATNDIFAENAWYFRNALVRANYTNLQKDIHETTEYLEVFLRNLLLNEKNELHNRNLHISALFNNRKVDIQDKKVDIESVLSEKGKDFSRIVFLLNFLLHI